MADQLDTSPQAQTLRRSRTVCDLIQRTFAVTYSHLSQLEGRTIEQFFGDKNTPYITKFFKDHENSLIKNNEPVEKYETRLLHKLLKNCCGLKPHNDEAWESQEEADTLEFLITYCWTEFTNLCEASEMTDSDLNHHMDKVLEALVLIIEKVEEKENVDESSFKSELIKHIGEKSDLYTDNPLNHHEYAILSQHLVHVMLITVYKQLNNLKGMKLGEFLIKRRINVVPQTLYSNEHKFLEQNPSPQNMSIRLLQKVVKRVCFDFTPRMKSKQQSALESILKNLVKEYNTPPVSEEEYMDKSYKIYKLLRDALVEVKKQKGDKSLREIIDELPVGPYIVESFRKPFELPHGSTQSLTTRTAIKRPSPSESHVPAKCLVTSPSAPSQAMATASTAASSKGGLTQEEINVAVLFKVLCPGGVVVQTLALVFKALKGNVKNIRKEGKAYKNGFLKHEREEIESQNFTDGDALANKDVTFVCKLLRESGCNSLSNISDVWTRPGNTLEYSITFIKQERNCMSHDISKIETNELNKKLQSINMYLNTILEMTEQKLGPKDSDMKKALDNQKKKIDSEIQTALDMPESMYYMTMQKMKENMTNKIRQKATRELQAMNLYRENLLSMSPISGSDDTEQALTIKDIYVDRELEDMSDMKAYWIEDVLFCKDNSFASSRVIIIHGRPGEGKTSVCKHAYRLWSADLTESSKNGMELLIYIPCRFVTTKSISAYLKERLPETFENIDRDDIIPLMRELMVLFVVDGYDEAGGEAKSLIDDILTSMPESRIIITTKTQWLPKITRVVKSVTSYYNVLKMMEVTDDMRQEVIRKIFNALGKDTGNCNKFIEYLNKVKQKICALICRPLTFCLLSLLWIKKPDVAQKTQTLAQLYHELTDLTLQRVSKKIIKDKVYCRECMIQLGEIAWKNLLLKQHYLDKHDLDKLKRKALIELKLSKEEYNCIISSLIHCDEVHDSLDTMNWNFMINTQQEYFAAEYIVDCLLKEKSLSISKILELDTDPDENYYKKLQRLVQLIEFVCGLLALYKELTEVRVKDIAGMMSIGEPWAFTALTNMFKPLLQRPGVERAVKHQFRNQEMNTFENYDPQSILWIMKHTSLTVPNQVNLTNTVSELTHVKPLLQYLKSKGNYVKVTVDVNKVSNTSDLNKLAGDMRHENVVLTFMPWKPMCIATLVQSWDCSRPLRLFLLPEVLHLVWWKLLICLLSLSHKVTKITYSSQPGTTIGELVEEGAQWLAAQTATDSTLAPTELLIFCG